MCRAGEGALAVDTKGRTKRREDEEKGDGKGREGRRQGRVRQNGICTGSRPNPTSSKCRKDGSGRVKATRSECHPLRKYPARARVEEEFDIF